MPKAHLNSLATGFHTAVSAASKTELGTSLTGSAQTFNTHYQQCCPPALFLPNSCPPGMAIDRFELPFTSSFSFTTPFAPHAITSPESTNISKCKYILVLQEQVEAILTGNEAEIQSSCEMFLRILKQLFWTVFQSRILHMSFLPTAQYSSSGFSTPTSSHCGNPSVTQSGSDPPCPPCSSRNYVLPWASSSCSVNLDRLGFFVLEEWYIVWSRTVGQSLRRLPSQQWLSVPSSRFNQHVYFLHFYKIVPSAQKI